MLNTGEEITWLHLRGFFEHLWTRFVSPLEHPCELCFSGACRQYRVPRLRCWHVASRASWLRGQYSTSCTIACHRCTMHILWPHCHYLSLVLCAQCTAMIKSAWIHLNPSCAAWPRSTMAISKCVEVPGLVAVACCSIIFVSIFVVLANELIRHIYVQSLTGRLNMGRKVFVIKKNPTFSWCPGWTPAVRTSTAVRTYIHWHDILTKYEDTFSAKCWGMLWLGQCLPQSISLSRLRFLSPPFLFALCCRFRNGTVGGFRPRRLRVISTTISRSQAMQRSSHAQSTQGIQETGKWSPTWQQLFHEIMVEFM